MQANQSKRRVPEYILTPVCAVTDLFCVQAMLDTVLVLGIVIASGSLLFGLNVLLAEGSEWWYHRG